MGEPVSPPAPGGRILIVMADGTSNAFGGQPTNIWRLYEALDCSPGSNQIVRYIPGVGTSSFRPFRLFDAVTGVGVPGNVRKLYRFLCWTYLPGDQIWMFGFSRGAFTVRTLAGMIQRQGLMPRVHLGKAVSEADMHRNTRDAWRAYRAETGPLFDDKGRLRMGPWIAAVRWLRDSWIVLSRRVTGGAQHSAVLAARGAALGPMQFDQRGNPVAGVEVHFLGLFDTVEAYGLPLEDLRSVWDFWISPITFRNRRVSDVVRRVRHAMALDEERLTFTPLNCEKAKGAAGIGQDIQEVWFPGCHSDLGGGYPDDRPAFQALEWMASEAKRLGLKLRRGALTTPFRRRTPTAPIHDSRRGLSGFYRYRPRRIRVDPTVSPVPVVHPATTDMVLNGSNGYAPLTLQPGFNQLGGGLAALQPKGQGAVADLITARILLGRLNYGLIGALAFLVARGLLALWRVRACGAPGQVWSALPGNWVGLLGLCAASATCIGLGWALRDRIRDEARVSWGGLPVGPDRLTRGLGWLGGKARQGKVLERVFRPWRAFVMAAVPALVVYGAYLLFHWRLC